MATLQFETEDGAAVRTLSDFVAACQLTEAPEGYEALLSRGGVEVAELRTALSEEALLSMGVSKPFHRKRMLRHATKLRLSRPQVEPRAQPRPAPEPAPLTLPTPQPEPQPEPQPQPQLEPEPVRAGASAPLPRTGSARGQALAAVMDLGFPEVIARDALSRSGHDPELAITLILSEQRGPEDSGGEIPELRPGDKSRLDQLASLGFDPNECLQAYFNCGRDVAAAESLLRQRGAGGFGGSPIQQLRLRHAEAARLFRDGNVYDAVEVWGNCVRSARTLGERRKEGVFLGSLGLAYHKLGDAGAAIEHSKAALALARELGDLQNEGNWLGNIGLTLEAMGGTAELEKAIGFYREALSLARELGNAQAVVSVSERIENAQIQLSTLLSQSDSGGSSDSAAKGNHSPGNPPVGGESMDKSALAVARLSALGFDREACALAYRACGGAEELAVEMLLAGGAPEDQGYMTEVVSEGVPPSD
jgi:tetratricopeptide (TPR) repeat protein